MVVVEVQADFADGYHTRGRSKGSQLLQLPCACSRGLVRVNARGRPDVGFLLSERDRRRARRHIGTDADDNLDAGAGRALQRSRAVAVEFFAMQMGMSVDE
jgi:hypothetical protein